MKNKKVYFFVTFSSLSMNFAIKNITHAMMIKYINAAKNGPQPMPFHTQILKTAVCHAPPGINGVMKGITMLSTRDFTRVFAANAIITAIASPITLYSLRKSLNSLTKPMLFLIAICVCNVF